MANFSDPTMLYQQDVETVSEKLISETLGLECSFPIDLFKIIEMWGIDINWINDASKDFLAKIELTACPLITINSEFSFSDIQKGVVPLTKLNNLRFSIAHELGHLFLNINHKSLRERMLIFNTKKNADLYTRITEFSADNFASALLMPKFALKNYLSYDKNPKTAAENISNAFGVSLTSAFLRLAKTSENITACVQINRNTKNIKHVSYSKSWSDIGTEHRPYKVLFLSKKTDIPKMSATNTVLNNPESGAKNIRTTLPLERWFENYQGEHKIHEWPYLFEHNIVTFLEVEYPEF